MPCQQHRFKGFASNNWKHSNILFSLHPLRLVVPRRLPLKLEFLPSPHPGRRPVVPPTLETPTSPSRPCSSHISSHFFLNLQIFSFFISPFCLRYTKTHSVIHPRLPIMYTFPDCTRCTTRSIESVYPTPVVKWIGIQVKAFRLKGGWVEGGLDAVDIIMG